MPILQESSQQSRRLSLSFKEIIQSMQVEKALQNFNPEKLSSALMVYIEKRSQAGNTKSIFGKYTMEDKVNAAQALILALNGHHVTDLKQHADVLKDGSLGKIIGEHINASGPQETKITALFDAIENGSIQPIEPTEQVELK